MNKTQTPITILDGNNVKPQNPTNVTNIVTSTTLQQQGNQNQTENTTTSEASQEEWVDWDKPEEIVPECSECGSKEFVEGVYPFPTFFSITF